MSSSRASSDPTAGQSSSPTSSTSSSLPSAFEDADRATARCAFVIAVILLGQAIWLGIPGFSGAALALIALAIAAMATGIGCRAPETVEAAARRWLRPLLGAALAGGFARALDATYLEQDVPAAASAQAIRALTVVAAGLAAVVLLARSRTLVTGAFLLVVTLHGLIAGWYVSARVPGIDVYWVQSFGCDALVSGKNPYAMVFPTAYPKGSPFIHPDLVVDGIVQSGFPYPPLTLLLDLPGHAMGDVRYAHVIALSLSALLVGLARPGRRESCLAAIALLFTPGTFYMLQRGWTEPLALLPLCAAAWLAARRWLALAAGMLGLFLAAKQFIPLAAPAALLLVPRPWRMGRIAGYASIALVTGAAVTLPFVLWGPRAFVHSLSAQPVGLVRTDSLSLLPTLLAQFDARPSLLFPAAAALAPAAWALWRSPRTPSGLAASAALILTCVFAFSTISFGNYYWLAVGALCAAVGGAGVRTTTKPVPVPASAGEELHRASSGELSARGALPAASLPPPASRV